jgi:hypothetical protein
MPQRHIFFVSQKLKHGGKYRFEDISHPLGTEAIKSAKVGSLPSGQPHEGNVLPYRFGDLARRNYSLSVSEDNDFGEHFRVVAVTAATRIGSVKDGVVQSIDGCVNERDRGDVPECLLPDPLANKVGPWYIEYTKETSPLKWLVALPFYQRKVSFFMIFRRIVVYFPLKQRRGRTDCGKAVAVALVSGFSPLREMKKIWRAQRLEQRSVRAASSPSATVYPTLKTMGVPAISWLLGQPLSSVMSRPHLSRRLFLLLWFS